MFFRALGFNEPMPDFESRFPGKLESCLEMPFARFGKVHFHRGILKKAVAYFYYCTKDHPFENGNKRSAVVIMLYFLAKNGMWLDVDPIFLYEVSKALAETQETPEVAMRKLADAFKPHLETFRTS